MDQPYSSQLLEQAVQEFSKLPGIGRKTALRLALHMLKLEEPVVNHFADSIVRLRHEVRRCRICHNISDTDVCAICASKSRDERQVCVVQNFQDVMAIEQTAQYHGLYHVLGGVISPLEGISPADLEIGSLVERVRDTQVDEVILALPSTMEGDTTNFYLFRQLAPFQHLKITALARGIATGDELQYTDEVTLSRAIVGRLPFNI